MADDGRLILMHGFTKEEAQTIMRVVRMVFEEDPLSVAFAMSTENNLDWPIGQLIQEVRKEHAYMVEQWKKQQAEGGAGEGETPQEGDEQ
jgi:hypothetical protein